MERFKNGLILGKFLPLHKGHLYLIDSAINMCDNIYIMACSIDNETMPGKIRYESIRYLYSKYPNVTVIEVTDNNPQYPEESVTVDVFYDIWVKTVYKNIKKLDVIFTSEKYGDEFAKYLNIKHILIDLPRKKYPISGTKIRRNVKDNWEFIPYPMKNYFIKKIAIVGPESSGKTTISKMLSSYYNSPNVYEYGRKYINDIGMNLKTRNELSIMDISHIASGQIMVEDECLENCMNNILICDTNLMITQIWSEIYFNKCPKWIVDESYNRKYDLHLLMDIDFDWQDDKTREFPEIRKWHFNRIKEEMESRGINYKIISGSSIEEKIEKCKKIINEVKK